MTIHNWFHERNDPVRAAREQEDLRIRRWDDALRSDYQPPLHLYLDGGWSRMRRPNVWRAAIVKSVRVPKSGIFQTVSVYPWPDAPGRGLIWTALRGLTLAAFAATIALAGYIQFGEDPLVAQAVRAADCAKATMLRQDDGQVFLIPVDRSDDCVPLRSHLSVAFDDAAMIERRADRIAVLEGRYRIADTIFGFEWRGIPRKILGKDGFSGPILSAFENVIGQPASLKNRRFRKLRNVIASMQFARLYLTTDAARAVFIVHHMPVLTGMRLDPVAGAYPEALLFSGNEPEIVRDCLSAAAAGFPLYLKEFGDKMETRWTRAVDRAKVCISRSAADQDEAGAALAYLETMPAPGPMRPAVMRQPVLNTVFGFERRHGREAAGGAASLTLNSAMETELLRAVPEGLNDLDRKTGDGFCAMTDDCEPHLDALVALAEITGNDLMLRAVYNSRQGLLFGPTKQNGRNYQPVADRLGNASLNKLLLLLPVAKSGASVLCNQQVAEFHNVHAPAGVESCNPQTGDGYVPVVSAVRFSLNLPWISAAGDHAAAVTALQDALEFVPTDEPETAPEMALGFGRYGAPAKMMTLAAALVNGGRINGLTLYREVAVQGLHVAELGYSETDVARAAAWFQAPLQKGGTMAGAAAALNIKGCVMTHGKSGTFFADGRNQARYGLTVIQCGARRFVAYAGVSAKRMEHSTGSINQTDLVRLYRSALAVR